MKCHLRLPAVVLFLILALFAVGSVSAQTGEVTDDEVNEVAKDLFCPVCENTPLDVCPTQACADWRELIRTQLAEGKTEEEVHEYFTRQYGDGVLSDPPRRGFNMLLWIFPVTAVVLGGGLFIRYLLRLRQAPETTPPAATAALNPRTPTASGNIVEAEVNAPPSLNPADAEPDYITRVEEELMARK